MVGLSRNIITNAACHDEICEAEVGGKGWNLFRLQGSGLGLPPWFVISSSVFNDLIYSQRDRIGTILNNLNFMDQNAVDEASMTIRGLVLQLHLAEEVKQDISHTVRETFKGGRLLSVRSSVVGEDSKENSFAGQMDSFLNVSPSEVMETVKKVWGSAFSPRVLVYRHRKKMNLKEISTAVIIQEMVQAAASGVLFTREPQTKERQCVISAGFGLGPGVVENIIETDTYKIGWNGGPISKEIRRKDCRLVLDTTSGAGNRIEPVPQELQLSQILTDPQIQELRGLGVKAEGHFGAPQDIEWAFDEQGRLFILQTRPIIFSDLTNHQGTSRIWDNSNIVESYPGLTLPLTFSFVRKGYETSFRDCTLSLLFWKHELKKEVHIFKNMIGLLDGRIYYNLLNWYKMLSYLPGFQKHKESWDQMIGISQKTDFSQSKLSLSNRIFSALIASWKLMKVRRNAQHFFTRFNSRYSQFRGMDLTKACEDELIALYECLGQEYLDKWHMTLNNDFCAMKYYDWLKKLCRRWGLEKWPNLHNDLLCGEVGVESVAPVRSLVRIAEMFREKADYRILITGEDNQGIWENIQSQPEYSGLREALDVHLDGFGDRGLEELKLERSTLREEPSLLIRLIKDYYRLGLCVEEMEKQEQEIRGNAERIVLSHLSNPLKRLVFWFVLTNARLAIVNRENMRFARSRLFGIVRRLFRRMGDLFVQKDLLTASSDIYYLTVDEVFDYVQGTAVTQNLRALVQLRKTEYKQFVERTPEERVETTGIPYLSSLCSANDRGGTGKTLRGIGCSSGFVEGKAKVILDPQCTMGNGDNILVAKSTDPGWVFLMISSKGIVVEKGSLLSHTAIIGRELGIPTIVGAKHATWRIPDGVQTFMNGSTGEIRWQ